MKLLRVAGCMLVVIAVGVACDWFGVGRGGGWPGILLRAAVVGGAAGAYYVLVERRRGRVAT